MEPNIRNRLAAVRRERGIAAAALAAATGASRQTIYAIEAGTFVPNTALALKLARALDTKVDDLFALGEEAPAGTPEAVEANLLPGSERPREGQSVRVCRVDRRLVAFAASPPEWYFPAADGVAAGGQARSKSAIRVFETGSGADTGNRLLVAGCDPAIGVLARHARQAGVELVAAHRNSSQALGLLKESAVHIAGTHLRDEASGESNTPAIARLFARDAVAVVTYAEWEEGIVTAWNNPKSIRGVEDLANPRVEIVNRESGAGSRRLLDDRLKRLGIPAASVRGYRREAEGHLAAAWQVKTGAADACIATRAAARLFGLGFVPLVRERYDLVVRRRHLSLPAIERLFEILGRASFRREIEMLGGYDARMAGRRVW